MLAGRLRMKCTVRTRVGVVLLMVSICGCESPMYYLPGHSSRNYVNPPPVTMRVGERRILVSRGGIPGLSWGAFPPDIYTAMSLDTNVAVVDYYPRSKVSYVRAFAAGSTRVKYFPIGSDNHGFEVTVTK